MILTHLIRHLGGAPSEGDLLVMRLRGAASVGDQLRPLCSSFDHKQRLLHLKRQFNSFSICVLLEHKST